MSKITDLTARLALPFIQAAGCTLWDVEYVKEAGTRYLRVFIDKDGGLSTDDCEAVSRPLSDALDEADPIPESYTLEVGSAGIDRPLRRPEHFRACLGQTVDVKLYRPVDGRKLFTGTLDAYGEDGAVTVDGTVFAENDVAQVRLHVDF